MPASFQEKQNLSGGWKTFTWVAGFIPTIGVALWFGYGVYQQVVLGEPFGNNPTSDEVMVFISVFLVVLAALEAWLFRTMHLQTELNNQQLSLRFVPLRPQIIQVEEVDTCKVMRNTTLGVGKQSLIGETRYSMGSKQAVQLILKSGQKILIGSQRAEELAAAIQNAQTGSLSPHLSAAETWQAMQAERASSRDPQKR